MNRLEQPDLAIDLTFHGHDFSAAVVDIEKVCGKVMYTDNDIDEQTQNEWEMQTEDGTAFTIYDFKEYREYDSAEKITWHIGAGNRFGAKKGYEELKRSFHLHPKIEYNI
jgi:hypothetical protein|tara:strand:- start:137 stop:466 length:330 start_codon:yes stop_codon:yes gene_type:complete